MELNIAGVAEGGIPVDYAHMFAYINGSSDWAGVIPALILGLVRAYGLDSGKYFNDTGQQVLDQVAKGCLVRNAYPGLHFEDLLRPEYRNWIRCRSWSSLQRRDHGDRGHAARAPLHGDRELRRDRRRGDTGG